MSQTTASSETHLSGIIPPVELHHWIDSGKPLLLINVMGEGCFEEERIDGSSRACVYETTFLDQVQELNADRGASIVVYGTGPDSHASQVAAEKLRAAGYTHVYDLHGGLTAWRADGYPTLRGPASPAPQPLTGTFNLDLEKSVVRWTGRNLLNHHEGTVRFTSGEIEIADGALVRADFHVDLQTIACADLTDSSWNAMLIRHLHDADFFDVAQWPIASFTTTTATPIIGATPGTPGYTLSGGFTLRGQTHEIDFPAAIGLSEDGTLGGQAEFDLDRTRWGAIYGSGKFFDRLGAHLVNDLVHLHLKIVAQPKA